eukprot:TRINITY_DN24970_c0_g1_i1.p1 TRINITY_DN24970_c0_g1~~TRINITY_DN24970_c0_g1_i1.p1  ORF type:complete len:362 (+),score=42.43 TRINITY_DN24970_c0_g1_i1:119-1204(+)
MSVSRRVSGVAQRSATLWRQGVRPDKGHEGFDATDERTFPKWFVPGNGEWYQIPKDESELRDRLCGVKMNPGQYPSPTGKGRLTNWLLINRTGEAVVRNPYSGYMDNLGPIISFRQCENKGWTRTTMFHYQTKKAEGYVTIQGLMTWGMQDHWHSKLMKSTWNKNSIDVYNAVQEICKMNDSNYVSEDLKLETLPISRFTEGHPSPPRWELPLFAESRAKVDKVETGSDNSLWNNRPSPFGMHKSNPAYYPELRSHETFNLLDDHLQFMGRHPHNLQSTKGYTPQEPTPRPHRLTEAGGHTKFEDYFRAIPTSTAIQYKTWTVFENQRDRSLYDGAKETHIGDWPVRHPLRGTLNFVAPIS